MMYIHIFFLFLAFNLNIVILARPINDGSLKQLDTEQPAKIWIFILRIARNIDTGCKNIEKQWNLDIFVKKCINRNETPKSPCADKNSTMMTLEVCSEDYDEYCENNENASIFDAVISGNLVNITIHCVKELKKVHTERKPGDYIIIIVWLPLVSCYSLIAIYIIGSELLTKLKLKRESRKIWDSNIVIEYVRDYEFEFL